MALPSGNFFSPRAGRLFVTFSGRWTINNTDPTMSVGSWDLVLQGYVGSGASIRTCRLSIVTNTATLEYSDYPGGNVLVPVGMTVVGHTMGGAGAIIASLLTVRCRLTKK